MRQRRRPVRVRRCRRVADACGCRDQQCWRHHCCKAIRDACALAMIGAVAAAFLIRSGCVLRRAAVIHAAVRHAVMRQGVIRHTAVRVRCVCAHVFVTGLFRSRRCSGHRVVRTSCMHRRHRTTDAVRHQGEAEQGVQQDRANAHSMECTPGVFRLQPQRSPSCKSRARPSQQQRRNPVLAAGESRVR